MSERSRNRGSITKSDIQYEKEKGKKNDDDIPKLFFQPIVT